MRLFSDGAEYGDMLSWSGYNGAAPVTNQKRTGVYSYELIYSNHYASKNLLVNSTEVYLRFGLYCISNTFQNANTLICLLIDSAGSGVEGSITINRTTRKMEIWRGNISSKLFTANSTIPNNTWKLIELYYKVHDTLGIATLKIDGIIEGTFSGDTKNGAGNIRYLNFNQNANGERWIDDIAINNTDNSDGKNDNTWCGDGHIERFPPNGNSPDSWSDQWVGSDGNSTDNYALVDEVPPNSSDYVQSEILGYQDRYALGNWSGTGKRIKRIWAEARALDVSAISSKMKLGFRVNGSDYLSPAVALPASYSRIISEDFVVNPNTSAEWTNGEFDATQIVMEVAE